MPPFGCSLYADVARVFTVVTFISGVEHAHTPRTVVESNLYFGGHIDIGHQNDLPTISSDSGKFATCLEGAFASELAPEPGPIPSFDIGAGSQVDLTCVAIDNDQVAVTYLPRRVARANNRW